MPKKIFINTTTKLKGKEELQKKQLRAQILSETSLPLT